MYMYVFYWYRNKTLMKIYLDSTNLQGLTVFNHPFYTN